jgi:hypothetical protein
MYGAWIPLPRQKGCLQCLSSVGLLVRIYMVCLPPTASYGCEVWGHYRLPPAAANLRRALAKLRGALAKSYLHLLRQIWGVSGSTAEFILLAELGLQSLPDAWLLRRATFWNALAALPPASLYKKMALNTCAWCLLACLKPSGKRDMIWRLDRTPWTLLTSRSCAPTSDSAGVLSEEVWTFAPGPA